MVKEETYENGGNKKDNKYCDFNSSVLDRK